MRIRAYQTALLLVSSLISISSQANPHISRVDDPCSVAAAAFTETQGLFPGFLGCLIDRVSVLMINSARRIRNPREYSIRVSKSYSTP